MVRRIAAIRRRCLTLEERYASSVQRVAPGLRPSARNLLHYVGLRQSDLRDLQHDLALRGLSSLGRCDSHVMSALEAVQRGRCSSVPRGGCGSFRLSQGSAFFLFQVITLDNWSHLYRAAQAGAPVAAPIYFISFILRGTMIMLNLFIGIIMNSMSEMHAEITARDPRRHVAEATERLRRCQPVVIRRAGRL